MLHKDSVTCLFVYILWEPHCYLSLKFFTSKNVSRALFIDLFLLNELFSFFCRILICEYVSHKYVFLV